MRQFKLFSSTEQDLYEINVVQFQVEKCIMTVLSETLLPNSPRGVTYDIATRGCAYEEPNPDPKICRVHQTAFPKFQCMMPISYPNLWVPNFILETRVPSTLAQNVLYKLRNDFKPNWCTLARDLEQQNPQNGSLIKNLTEKYGKFLGKNSFPKI